MRVGRRVLGVRMEAVLLIGALLGVAAWLLAGIAGADASETVTTTFGSTGAEQTFVVPVGVTSIAVRAVGGTGKGGGAPAEVTGSIGVTPGQTLYVEVGGSPTGAKGGFNGGGEASDQGAGGGGGASDIRTVPRASAGTLNSRLIVAGASGGAASDGHAGGAAGAEGQREGEGGKPGTQTKGGEAEEFFECTEGHDREGDHTGSTNGSLGNGGRGEGCESKFHGGAGGGGGGAGLYGGGGGAVEFSVEPLREWGTGGGGGSSLVPEGGTSGLAEGAPAVIELTYAHPESPPVVSTGSASSVKALSATLNATVDPEDNTVTSCEFEYGTSVSYEHSAPCATSPGSGDQPVAVSAAISGLAGATTYHYRIVATNGEGATSGSDAEFTTVAHEPPTVSEYSPREGKAGTVVIFTGTDMDHVTDVDFDLGSTTAAEIEHVSPTTLRVVVPNIFAGFAYNVVLHDNLGNEVAAGSFEVVQAPAISKLSTKKSPTTGGTTLVITGTTLDKVTEVLFGSTPGTIQSQSFTTLTVTTPAHASGKYPITAISVGGPSAASKKAVFDFAGLEVTGVSPSSGPLAGGSAVTVTGAGFAPGSGTTAFVFGKVAATGVECSSTTECTMTAPAGAKAGTVDVRATIVGGKGKSKKSLADHYAYE